MRINKLREIANQVGASYISSSDLPHQQVLLDAIGFFRARAVGPEMTFRPLNFEGTAENTMASWLPLMGAMELF